MHTHSLSDDGAFSYTKTTTPKLGEKQTLPMVLHDRIVAALIELSDHGCLRSSVKRVEFYSTGGSECWQGGASASLRRGERGLLCRRHKDPQPSDEIRRSKGTGGLTWRRGLQQ